jgi:hypothetical protein
MRLQNALRLSIWTLLKLVWARGYERVLILEDDAIIQPERLLAFERAINTLESVDGRWDMLYLYARVF